MWSGRRYRRLWTRVVAKAFPRRRALLQMPASPQKRRARGSTRSATAAAVSPVAAASTILHAHHIEAWAEGGNTSTSNLVLLCPSHHALVHEGQLFVDILDGKVEFRNAHGLGIRPAPDRGGDLEAIDHWLRSTDPGFDRDGNPKWDGRALISTRSRVGCGSRRRPAQLERLDLTIRAEPVGRERAPACLTDEETTEISIR